MKNLKYLVLILLLMIILLFLFLNSYKKTFKVEINQKSFIVERAETNEEKLKGLMYRETLEPDRGMLFIFKNEEIMSFWMKNTLIPLDMIFINKEKNIVDIQSAYPCIEDPCLLYTSKKPSMYVLEINSGLSEKNSFKVGDKVRF